jgi:hypothetical protein
MSITGTELTSIVVDLTSKHEPDAARAAGMRHLCVNLMDHYGKHYGIDLSPMKSTLAECIDAFLAERGLDSIDLEDAADAISRAGETVAYIDRLPA